MPERRQRRGAAVVAATGVLLAVSMLSACGGPTGAPTPTPEPSISASADVDTAPPTAPGGTQTPSTVPQEPSAPQSTRSPGQRPSRSEVRTGLSAYIRTEYGASSTKATTLADCIIDAGYDDWTTNTLIAMVDGVPADVDENDTISVQRALRGCGVPLR